MSHSHEVTIYHNPACGTSRNTIALLESRGIAPRVIEYLKTPPSRDELKTIIRKMGVSIRDMMRKKGSPYEELNLDDPKWSDEQLIDFMMQHPILINRPIVVTAKGAKLCRPPENALDLI